MTAKNLTKEAVAAMIDHTNLKATATREDIRRLCEEAKTYRFASVMVNSAFTAFCKELVAGSGVLGSERWSASLSARCQRSPRCSKPRFALSDGANEIDYVVNVSDVKDGNGIL